MSVEQRQRTVLVGEWTVLVTVDEDGHLTINALHSDMSEVLDISDDYGDAGFKARLTTRKSEDDYRRALGMEVLT